MWQGATCSRCHAVKSLEPLLVPASAAQPGTAHEILDIAMMHPAERPFVSIAALTALPEPRVAFDRISLRPLVLIRWVAIAGQAVTLLIVHFAFDFRLPLLRCFAVVGCSVRSTSFITLYRRVGTRLGEREATLFLGYDLLQLGVLLYLTGGLQNPFAILILAPVTVAATILSLRPVIALAVFAIAVITLLALWHLPLPWRGERAGVPARIGARVVDGAGARHGVYRRLHLERRRGGAAVARCGSGDAAGAGARAAGLRGRRLGCGGGARTRQPARDDRRRRPRTGARPARRFATCRRCRSCCSASPSGAARSSAQLARHRTKKARSPYTRLPISALVEAGGALYHEPRIRLIFATTGEPADAEPLVRRSPEIMHGVNNLIQNAVQFARSEVSVAIHWDPNCYGRNRR